MNVSRRKNIAITLIFAMLFTSIPFLSHGTQVGETSPTPEVSLEDEITTENVEKTDAIEDKNTENSTTFDLGGNQKMLVLYGGEVRYEDENGNLIDYDPSLVQITDQESMQGENLSEYVYENKQSDSKQYLPETLSEDSPVLMEKDKYKIKMVPISGDFASEKVSLKKEETLTAYEEIEKKDVKAIYESEAGDTSYEYVSINNGIKENLILNEKPENNVYKYRLSLNGLIPEITEDKYINLNDKETGKTIAVIDKPFMNDASGDAYSEDIETTIEQDTNSDEDYLLTLTLSRKYLNAKERVYPITVDPSATWQGSSEVTDVYAISGYPSTNFYTSGVKKMVVGRGVDGTHRTYIGFQGLLTAIKGKYVDSAKFTMYETAGLDTGRTVNIYNLATTWSASKLNWNNKPLASGGAMTLAVTNGKTNHAMVFDLTNHVRKYANSTYGNYGMMMKDSTETAKSYTEYYGSRTTATSYRPKLVVTYYDGPTTATSVTATKTYIKKGTSASLKYAGITSKNLAKVQYRVATANETTGAIINDSYKPYANLGVKVSSGTVSIPGSSTFPEGRYRMYLRGVDAGGIKGTGLGATVIIDGTNPSLTGVSVSPKTSVDSYDKGAKAKISFTATDKYLSKVEVLVDSKVVHTTTAKGASAYTLQEGDITVSGAHDIQVSATDKAGNITTSAVTKYYTDMEAPAITKATISPATTSSAFSKVTTPKVTFDVADVNLKNAAVYVRNEDSAEKKAGL